MRSLLWPLMSEAGRAAWISLQQVDEWKIDHHTVDHKSDLRLWTASGWLTLQPYHSAPVFNLADKLAVWKQVKALARRKLAARLLSHRLTK